jgi:molybdopterin-guanine dinucleotide biosynthesis protein A
VKTETATSAARPDAAGFVLAGGQSSRMGSDKALVELDGKPLIAHALQSLREAGLVASIAGARSPLQPYAPVVEDSEPDHGPLSGVCAALTSTSAPWAVILPIDLPLLPASLLVFMLHHARVTGAAVTLASVNGFSQTFPAILHRPILPALENELKAGRTGCFSAFQTASATLGLPMTVLPVELLAQTGHVAHSEGLPPVRWFLNVNAPAHLLQANSRRSAARRVS